MPNWCHTRLSVEGSPENVSAFIAGLGVGVPTLGNLPCASILETYYPIPEEYDAGWQTHNYGSKWADCHTYLEEYDGNDYAAYAVFTFDSAWSPLSQGFRHLSELFPDLRFELSHEEEADFFCGAEVFRDGHVLFSDLFDPEDHYKATHGTAPDFDTEEGCEKYNQTKWDAFHAVEERAQKVGRP